VGDAANQIASDHQQNLTQKEMSPRPGLDGGDRLRQSGDRFAARFAAKRNLSPFQKQRRYLPESVRREPDRPDSIRTSWAAAQVA
jgi:hypothetical protein